MNLSPYHLGASLYMPAVRQDITQVVLHNKIPGLSSLIICFEDALAEKDLEFGLANLHIVMEELNKNTHANNNGERPLIFIRPRNIEIAKLLVSDFDLRAINGFVLPKFTLSSLSDWYSVLGDSHLMWMPTLETQDVFDVIAMTELAKTLENHPCREKILAMRVGGNDLLSVLSLRRQRECTLYEGPLGYVMKMLVSVFSTRGFALTSPVCELIERTDILLDELQLDIEHGFVGKTAIHPSQVSIINQALSVSQSDYEDAMRINNSEVAVFKHQGAMCEPATHARWAKNILSRAQHYGREKINLVSTAS